MAIDLEEERCRHARNAERRRCKAASSVQVAMSDATATFNPLRPRLQGIAYRMLGSSAEAEEVVQDACLRWHEAAQERLESTEAWLVAVTARLDHRPAAQSQSAARTLCRYLAAGAAALRLAHHAGAG